MADFWFKTVAKLRRRFWQRHYRTLSFESMGAGVVIDNEVSFRYPKYIRFGNGVFIGKDSTIQCFDSYAGVAYEPHCVIGNGVTVTRRLTIYCANSVTIGDSTMIGSDVLIMDENHGTDPRNVFRENPLQTKPVTIGENVWIGDKVIILPGVTVGDNSIVAAGAVVTKSAPAYSMLAGNPARVIKQFNLATGEWESI